MNKGRGGEISGKNETYLGRKQRKNKEQSRGTKKNLVFYSRPTAYIAYTRRGVCFIYYSTVHGTYNLQLQLSNG